MYKLINGDCIEKIKDIESESIHFSIFSPPFAELYVYSDDFRDMGNCTNYDDFFTHFGFLTPEANKAVDEYLDERRKDGEHIDQDSPIFRSSYQIGIQKTKAMSTASAKMIALRLAKSVVRNKQGRRYSVMAAHGFRKRFSTLLKSADNANQALCEKLMGHRGIFHLDGSYLIPSKDQLFTEFKKHIPNLTIDDSERNKITIAKLEAEKSELESKNEEIQIQNDELARQSQAIDNILKELEELKKKTGTN